MKNKELTYEQGLKKSRLDKLKQNIALSIRSVSKYIEIIIKNLYSIEKEELYYFDACSNISDFIMQNDYHSKLSLEIRTIRLRMHVLHKKDELKITEKEMPGTKSYAKLKLITQKGIKGKQRVLQLVKAPMSELKKNLVGKSSPVKPGKKMKTKYIKFTYNYTHEKSFLRDILSVCRKYDAKMN